MLGIYSPDSIYLTASYNRFLLGSNYTAPLPNLNAGDGPKSILDVGSGSGQWVVEVSVLSDGYMCAT